MVRAHADDDLAYVRAGVGDDLDTMLVHNLLRTHSYLSPFIDADLDNIEGNYVNNRGDFIIGTVENDIIAIGALQKVSANLGEIRRIRVHRDHRRQGYGSEILSKLIERAVELGYTELCLDTLADNTPAQRLFEKGGFIESHHGKIGSYNLIFYRKKLNDGGK